jgi:hypothetical protein
VGPWLFARQVLEADLLDELSGETVGRDGDVALGVGGLLRFHLPVVLGGLGVAPLLPSLGLGRQRNGVPKEVHKAAEEARDLGGLPLAGSRRWATGH